MFFSGLAYFAAGIINESVERNIAYPESAMAGGQRNMPEWHG
jgi:hypothetical protein